MIIYHGTSVGDIDKFDLLHSNGTKDFGKGVYFTTNFDQAKKRACYNSKLGYVYEALIDETRLKVKFLKGEDLYYTLYLCRCDLEGILPDAIDDIEKCDVIIGKMLDGNIPNDFIPVAERFNVGDASFDELVEAAKLFDETWDQLCFRIQAGVDLLNASLNRIYTTRRQGKKIEIVSENAPR